MRRAFGTMAVLFALAGMAEAQTMAVPEGCTPVVTAHKAACTVTTVFACGEGYQVHGYRNGKMRDNHIYNGDWGLLEYTLDGDQARLETVPDTGKGMSLSALLAEGVVSETRQVKMNTPVIRDRIYDAVIETRLTGERVSVSGTEFQTAISLRRFMLKGNEALAFTYELLISEDRGLMLEGSFDRSTFGSDPELVDQTIELLAFDGDPGFLAARAASCGS